MTHSPFNGYNVAETTEIMRENGRSAMRDALDSAAVADSIKQVAQRASRCVLDQIFATVVYPGKGAPSPSK